MVDPEDAGDGAGAEADAVARHENEGPVRPRTSYWAIASLAASVTFFCPLLTVIGPLLAVRALVETRAHPERTGRGLALAALWIGAVCTIGWIITLIWWSVNVRGMLLHGPQDAFRAGYAGDTVAFRAAFIGPAAAADDATVRGFLDDIRKRHGLFLSAVQDGSVPAPAQGGGRDVVIPYVLLFDQGPVKADARLLLFARGLSPKLQSITLHDSQRGDLTYP